MNVSVLLFFLYNILITLLLGVKFRSSKNPVLKSFGVALLINAVAFAVWTFGLINGGSLLTSVTVGAVCFLVSLVFFLYTSVQEAQPSTRWLLTGLGAVAMLVIFYLGHISPSVAYISPEGFFFFNLQPLVQMLYIFGLAFTTLPAIDLVASKFHSSYSNLVRYGFIAEIVSGIMLITSKDTQVLYITGWIIGLVYLLLGAVLFFSKKAWNEN